MCVWHCTVTAALSYLLAAFRHVLAIFSLQLRLCQSSAEPRTFTEEHACPIPAIASRQDSQPGADRPVPKGFTWNRTTGKNTGIASSVIRTEVRSKGTLGFSYRNLYCGMGLKPSPSSYNSFGGKKVKPSFSYKITCLSLGFVTVALKQVTTGNNVFWECFYLCNNIFTHVSLHLRGSRKSTQTFDISFPSLKWVNTKHIPEACLKKKSTGWCSSIPKVPIPRARFTSLLQ